MKTETDFRKFWELDNVPRFPVLTAHWTDPILIEATNATELTLHAQALRALSLEMPKLSAPCWRLAFYYKRQPNDADEVIYRLRAGCDHRGWLADVPPEWIGTEGTALAFRHLRSSLAIVSAAQAKTISKVLTLFRGVPLEKHEVLQLPWFEPEWIRAFVCWVNFRHPSPLPPPAAWEGNPHAAQTTFDFPHA